jgi:hypothetical protein
MEKKVDILPISIYLVVVLYRHKHCRPQKVELDLACRDSTTTNSIARVPTVFTTGPLLCSAFSPFPHIKIGVQVQFDPLGGT